MLRFAESPLRSPPIPFLTGLVGTSAVMRELARELCRTARLPVPVVLRGESGTGKELLARALHDASPRAAGPFVAVNAAALTRDLSASELFGHRRGAFTGALSERRGALREASGGTLLLDEVGSLALEVQPQLLRALEQRAVRPLGGDADIPVDVRVVAATCEPLEDMVAAGRFRADLYERLAGIVLEVPPVRVREGDVPLLAEHLLAQLMLPHRVSAEGLELLAAHPLPGNVRQLRNVLVHAAMLAPHDEIELGHLERALAARASKRSKEKRSLTRADALVAIDQAAGNLARASRHLGVPRTSLRRLLQA